MNTISSHRRPGTSLFATLLCLALAIGAVVGAAVLFGSDSVHAATPATQRVVLRPVTTTGHAAKGYRVVTDHRRAISCDAPSWLAVDNGIAHCGSSADNALACWRAATKGRVLCLTDPFTHTLRSIERAGSFPAVRAPKHANPQALLTNDGRKYLARSGGAWSIVAEHPTWAGYYYERGTFARDVYGPVNGDGINHRHATWFVTAYLHDRGHGVRHGVARAYYVGTAR